MAQEVQTIAPEAVMRGADGNMRVSYDLLECRSRPEQWITTGAHLPNVNRSRIGDLVALPARQDVKAGRHRRQRVRGQ